MVSSASGCSFITPRLMLPDRYVFHAGFPQSSAFAYDSALQAAAYPCHLRRRLATADDSRVGGHAVADYPIRPVLDQVTNRY